MSINIIISYSKIGRCYYLFVMASFTFSLVFVEMQRTREDKIAVQALMFLGAAF